MIVALMPPLLSVPLLTRIISKYVLATSIELMKSQETILRVVQDSKAESTARLFNTLMLISSIIAQINRLSNLAEQAAKKKTTSSVDSDGRNQGAIRFALASVTPLRQMLKKKQSTSEESAVYTAHLSKHQLNMLESYREMFDMADTGGVGELNAEAFLDFLQSTGAVIDAEQAQRIFAIADIDNSGYVSWLEFVQACPTILPSPRPVLPVSLPVPNSAVCVVLTS
jgi:hypothetical protein